MHARRASVPVHAGPAGAWAGGPRPVALQPPTRACSSSVASGVRAARPIEAAAGWQSPFRRDVSSHLCCMHARARDRARGHTPRRLIPKTLHCSERASGPALRCCARVRSHMARFPPRALLGHGSVALGVGRSQHTAEELTCRVHIGFIHFSPCKNSRLVYGFDRKFGW